jgi:hypothetical protein
LTFESKIAGFQPAIAAESSATGAMSQARRDCSCAVFSRPDPDACTAGEGGVFSGRDGSGPLGGSAPKRESAGEVHGGNAENQNHDRDHRDLRNVRIIIARLGTRVDIGQGAST